MIHIFHLSPFFHLIERTHVPSCVTGLLINASLWTQHIHKNAVTDKTICFHLSKNGKLSRICICLFRSSRIVLYYEKWLSYNDSLLYMTFNHIYVCALFHISLVCSSSSCTYLTPSIRVAFEFFLASNFYYFSLNFSVFLACSFVDISIFSISFRRLLSSASSRSIRW